MRCLKRILAWLCCVGLIAGVAASSFAYIRHSPRFRIVGNHDIVHLSPDGSQLMTVKKTPWRSRPSSNTEGPLLIWQTRSGKVIELLDSVRDRNYVLSPDGRIVAAHQGDRRLVLVDSRTGERNIIRLPADGGWASPKFSPRGTFCILDRHLIDVAAKKIVKSFEHIHGKPCFSYDERWLMLYEDYFELSIWDLANALLVKKVRSNGNEMTCPPRSQIAVVWRTPPFHRSWPIYEGFEVWDLETLETRFDMELPERAHDACFHISGDDQFLALRTLESKEKSFQYHVEWLDLRTSVKLGKVPVSVNGKWGFSADGKYLFVENSIEERTGKKRDSVTSHGSLTVYHTASGIMRWSRPSVWSQSCLAGSSGMVLHQQVDGIVEAVELSSGYHFGFTPEDFRVANDRLTATSDGVSFAMVGRHLRNKDLLDRVPWLRWILPRSLEDDVSGLLVCDGASGSERFRLLNKGRFDRLLSDDGEILVAVDPMDGQSDDRLIEIWEVSPRRAFVWSIAASLVAAISLILLRAWRRRRMVAATAPISR